MITTCHSILERAGERNGSTREPLSTSGTGAAIDLPRLEAAVREMLLAIGEDPDREGLSGTPQRVARSYAELFAGLHQSAAPHLRRTFEHQSDELVIVTNIDVLSMCEHHLLPFVGKAHIAYRPRLGRVVGLSKLARTVNVFARRPQMQERLTSQIADAIQDTLEPEGVLVVVTSEHMCMKMRGVSCGHASMTTVARRGRFAQDGPAATDALNLIATQSAQN